jgi:putrescine transport system permease protein
MLRPGTRRLVLAVPWLWLGLFFLAPFILVLKISFAEVQLGVPPYTPLVDAAGHLHLTFANYRFLGHDAIYLRAYWGSIRIAGIATLLTLAIGYPLAYVIARAPAARRTVLLLLVMAPFWTSFLVRIYAWIGLLRPGGIVNTALMAIGVIAAPLHLMNTEGAAIFGIVYGYLPFMVLPLYARLEKLDPALLEAAADLGATPLRAFRAITLPWSWPGVWAGCLLVFIPALGEFVVPELLGGPDTLMIGKVMWSEFFTNRDWPMSAAATVALLALLIGPIVIFQAFARRAEAQS